MVIKRKKKRESLLERGIFKLEKMLIKAGALENTVSKGKKITRKATRKIAATTAAFSLVAALALPGMAFAKENKEESLENTETPIEMDAESNDITPTFEEPIEVPANVEITDETSTVTFMAAEEDVVSEEATLEVTEVNVEENTVTTETTPKTEVNSVQDAGSEVKAISESLETSKVNTKTAETEVVTPSDLDIQTIISGKNVSENENETKVIMPSDSTYVVFTTEDGKQVIWNVESLGNENQSEFINNYNGIADKKIGENYVFADGEGNIVYKAYAKDANGNLIINEDGTVKIIETVIGTMTVNENGEKVFVGAGNIDVQYGINTPKEVKDPNAHYEKPVQKEQPTPEPTPEPEKGTNTGSLVKTGDSRVMVVAGMACVALASGLLVPLASQMARRNETKRLILR